MRHFNKHELSNSQQGDRNRSGFFSMILVFLGLRLLSAIIAGILVAPFVLAILQWYDRSSISTITLFANIMRISILCELAAGITRLIGFVFLNGDEHRNQVFGMSRSFGLQVGMLLGIAGTVGAFFSSAVAAVTIGRANNLDLTPVGMIIMSGMLIGWMIPTIGKRLIERLEPEVAGETEIDQPSDGEGESKDIS